MDPRDAFARKILDEHGERLRRHLAWRGVPGRDLDDVLQEVVARACDVMETYDASRDLGSWLITIASNQASMFLRRPYVREEQLTLANEPLEQIDVRHGPEDLMIRRDRLAMLEQMLASMTAGQREVMIEYEIKEAPMPDVAREKGVTLGEAWSRWKAGVARCERWFRRWQASERSSGRDGVPIVLVPMLAMSESARRAIGLLRLDVSTGRTSIGRGLMKAAVAVLAVGCMSPGSSTSATVNPITLAELGALSRVATGAEGPAPPPAPTTIAPLDAASAQPRPISATPTRRAARDDDDAADLLMLQAETAHEAGDDVEAMDLLLDHSKRRTTGSAAAKRSKLMRETDGQ